MAEPVILASGSTIRATLLQNAGVPFGAVIPRVDEEAMRRALLEESASPRDIADALAEMKAARVSSKHPQALVIGCDQILALGPDCLSKPTDPANALAQLQAMRGKVHQLLSAAVIYQNNQPLWRHVGQVRMHMRDMSDTFLSDYVERNWTDIQHCVGAYKLESEGVRLFHRIEGDYFTVLGLPLLEILSYLTLRGTLPS